MMLAAIDMTLTLREFGTLSDQGASSGLDHQVLSSTSFQALKKWALRPRLDNERAVFRLISRYNMECIQVLNYVGLLTLPTGEQLEILPKITDGYESVAQGRSILLKMLTRVHRLPFHESEIASIEVLSSPWLEALIQHVLQQIARLTRAGLRKRYSRVQRELPVIKGRLMAARQVRQRPGRHHYFHVSYDEYSLDRAENRLVKTVLVRLLSWAQSSETQRLCRELLFVMDDVPSCQNVANDIRCWSRNRDMAMYQPLLPWIRLVLKEQAPIFGQGRFEGVSLLFPMERLFEEYVAICLHEQLTPGYHLQSQATSEYLVTHQENSWFNLRPDLLIKRGPDRIAVLDTKWKLLDRSADSTDKKYGLSQSDFYQMFAYSEKYLGGTGVLALIYPRTDSFESPLPEFSFGTAKLFVIPFDLECNKLVIEEGTLEFLQARTATLQSSR